MMISASSSSSSDWVSSE
ncbi:unnamed protein product, partial [Cuscuta europaea]